ncbi:hypothetical protein BDW68DRAFT_52243 [Aspergillus falconensis]
MSHPGTLELVNAFRSREQYAGKRVVVLGGSFSASDAVGDIYMLVQSPLYVSQSSHSPYITEIWNLPKVEVKPTIIHIEGQDRSKLKLTFSDGSQLEDVDKLISATGYRFFIPVLISRTCFQGRSGTRHIPACLQNRRSVLGLRRPF